MNIFYLNHDQKICAKEHLDKHVVKMIIEYAQLLCTAHRMLDGNPYRELNKNGRRLKRWRLFDNRELVLYKATHINHPCAIWCRQTINNYMWLYELFVSLCDEYTYRYGKTHKTDMLLRDVLKTPPHNISNGDFTSPAQAMPDKYKSTDAIQAYKDYYIFEKHSFAKWSKRNVPSWFAESVQ